MQTSGAAEGDVTGDTDRELIADLRRAFLDGATPSMLLKILADRRPGENHFRDHAADAFRAAFGVDVVRGVLEQGHVGPVDGLSYLNVDLLPEMAAEFGQDTSGTWLDGVSVRSLPDHAERLRDYQPEELARVWYRLDEPGRANVRGLIASKDHSWQVMKLLAALAERLQVKLAAAEAAAHVHANDSTPAEVSR